MNSMVTENICDLEINARTAFVDYGYSKGTIRSMIFIAKALMRLHIEQGEERFNTNIANNYVKRQENRYQNEEISRRTFLLYQSTTDCLMQICNGEAINKKRRGAKPILSA